jgi:hypothetical protein
MTSSSDNDISVIAFTGINNWRLKSRDLYVT